MPAFADQSFVTQSHSIIVTLSSMVGYNQTQCISATGTRDILQEILKAFGYRFVRPKIEILLGIHIAQGVSRQRLASAGDDLA
jgi:hypothetical protein